MFLLDKYVFDELLNQSLCQARSFILARLDCLYLENKNIYSIKLACFHNIQVLGVIFGILAPIVDNNNCIPSSKSLE
jgi:hypothetical protein